MAKGLSKHFGGVELTSSEDEVGEQAIFGTAARWMDYSGPVAVGLGSGREVVPLLWGGGGGGGQSSSWDICYHMPRRSQIIDHIFT